MDIRASIKMDSKESIVTQSYKKQKAGENYDHLCLEDTWHMKEAWPTDKHL